MANDITLPEAKFQHALDEYYGFLHAIVANKGGTVGPGQRLVTLNTITPFSIVKDKPLYNSFILRAYSDLVIRSFSASDAGSPKTPPSDVIDSANTADAWSYEYYRFMFPKLSQELKKYIQKPEIVAEIEAKELVWDGYWEAYLDELDNLEIKWEERAAKLGLNEEDNPSLYFEKKNDFYRKRKAKLERLYKKQSDLRIEIDALEVAHLDADGLLFKELRDYLSPVNQVKLPIRPELEDYVVSDPTKNPGDYDIRPALYPATGTQVFNNLLDTTNDGDEAEQLQRGYEIKRTKTTKYTHDTDWSASGSAKKFFFLRASLSVSEKTHFEQEITKIGSIKVGFRAIDDIVMVRGKWYSGAFLKSEKVKKWFEENPEFRDKLSNIITSAIVCRGLTVRLGFTTDIDQNSWRDLKTKGSAGLSIGGWNFGLKGHYNKRTEWDLKDVTNNSVTFVDGPNVCRIIGFKIERVLEAEEKFSGLFDLENGLDTKLIEAYYSGGMDYAEFQEAIASQ